MAVAALEVSTSAAKAVIFSETEGVLHAVSIPFAKQISNTVSQDPDGMVATAFAALARVVDEFHGAVDAIGLCGTWHSLLLLDGCRHPLGRIQTWADVTAASTVQALRKEKDLLPWFYKRTGCMLHAMYPIWKWMGRAKDSIPKELYLSSQMEYLFEAMTGETMVSANTASGTGFFNLSTLDWDDEILDFAGIRRSQLGKVMEMDRTYPLEWHAAQRIGLPSGIPVTIGGADGALTHIGLGGCSEGAISLSVGTSGAIRKALNRLNLPEQPTLWCYYLHEGYWLSGAATHAGSNLLTVLEWLGCREHPEQLEEAAQAIDWKDVPIFMPFLYGERSPGGIEDRRGGFHDLRFTQTPAHLYAAVLEGILFNLYHCYGHLGDTNQILRVSGGIIHSPFWMQMAADVIGKDLIAGTYAHDSVVGAAVTALKGIGLLQRLNEFQPALDVHVKTRPAMHEIYQRRFRRYLEIYQNQGEG